MPVYLSEDCTVEALKLADAVESRPGPPFGAVKTPIGQSPPESQHLLRLVGRPVLLLLHTSGRQIPVRLKGWEAQQLPTARRAMQRARAVGRSVQFEGTWRVGDPSPYGLQAAGDSTLPVVEQKGIPNG